jgi:hypothetical protein
MEKNLSSADDLKTIRKIMEESTRFLSLSGLSGIFAGIFAIAGTIAAWLLIPGKQFMDISTSLASLSGPESAGIMIKMIIDAGMVLILSVIFALLFSIRRARKTNKKIWTPISKRLVVSLLIPLITGGLFVIILTVQKQYNLIIPCFLIFYGLALVNAGKFTYNEVFYLGILELATGLGALLLPGFGLLFWLFGFGLLHIAYGLFMYRKYEA